MTIVTKICAAICLIFATSFCYPQSIKPFDSRYANSAFGFGAAANASPKTQNRGPGGLGIIFQGDIKTSEKIAIVPSLGFETPYDFRAGIDVKNYIRNKIYINGGLFLNANFDLNPGNNPVYVGVTAGAGYNLFTFKRQYLGINLHADYLQVYNENIGLVGVRLTYNFIFPPHKKLPPARRKKLKLKQDDNHDD